MAITKQARAHYTLHRQSRHRILSDLGRPDKTLNLKLTAWWELSFVLDDRFGLMGSMTASSQKCIPRGRNDISRVQMISPGAETISPVGMIASRRFGN
jgi:hypothetical protein